MNKPCKKCGKRPRLYYSIYCRQCRNEYVWDYRHGKRTEGIGPEDEKYAKTVLPDQRYTCPYCGNWRSMDGDMHESQAEADQCCGHGDTSTTPYLAEGYATPGKYDPRCRISLEALEREPNLQRHQVRLIPCTGEGTYLLYGKNEVE